MFARALSFLAFFLQISTALAVSYEPVVLKDVLGQVRHAAAHGESPVVIFDLDDTLLHSRFRSLRIFRDFGDLDEIQQRYPDEAERLAAMELSQIRYHVEDTMAAVGVTDPELVKLAQEYFNQRFFSNECDRDPVVEGARAYVQAIHAAGGHVVYLTGRDKPRMFSGTLYSLRSKGFPLGRRADLIMKPDKSLDDAEFKKAVFERISVLGEVVGGFENEPRNANYMQAAFPRATVVFLDTIHSRRSDVPVEGMPWIRNFKMPQD